VRMARTMRVSGGIDQTITPRIRVNATYSHIQGSRYLRGRNLNAPLNGARPDPAFANVVEVLSDADSHVHQLFTSVNMSLSTPSRLVNLPRWNWRRTNVRLSYWLGKAENQTDGPFVVPPSGTLATEWGPSPGDRRHRAAVNVNTQALKNLNASISLAGNTGQPYTITTGFDDNGDSIFNDRPFGVGRNTVRTPSQWTWSSHVSYSIPLGAPPSAIQEHGRDGGDRSTAQNARYRLTFTVAITNLTNRANFVGYSGVRTSPFFEQPTAV